MNWKKEIDNIISTYEGDYKDVAAFCSDWLLDNNISGLEPEAYNGFRCPRAWWTWLNKQDNLQD